MSRLFVCLVLSLSVLGTLTGCSDKERSYLEENTYSPNGDLKERRETRWRSERVVKEPREPRERVIKD